jgi:hypothetical protein
VAVLNGREVIVDDVCVVGWLFVAYRVSNWLVAVMDRRWLGGAKHKNWRNFLAVRSGKGLNVKWLAAQ